MITDLRFVVFEDGEKLLQAEHEMGEGVESEREWRTIRTFHYDDISRFDRGEIDDYIRSRR